MRTRTTTKTLMGLAALLILPGCGGGGGGNSGGNGQKNLPKSIAINPTGQFVYVTNVGNNTVLEYKVNPDGTLSRNGSIPTGQNPQDVIVSPNGQFVYVIYDYAMAGTGSAHLTTYHINGDGTLMSLGASAATARIQPDSITITPDDQYAYLCTSRGFTGADGFQKDTAIYKVNPDGSLMFSSEDEILGQGSGAPPAPGGVGSITLAPSGKYAYTGDGGIFAVQPDGALKIVSRYGGGGALSIAPDGSFLYTSTNLVAGSGVSYKLNGDGTLAGPIETGANPGFLAFTPDSKFAYVADRNNEVVAEYRVNGGGTLTSLGSIKAGGQPVSMVVSPSGQFAYVVDIGTNVVTGSVLQFKVNTDGTLSSLTPPTVATGS